MVFIACHLRFADEVINEFKLQDFTLLLIHKLHFSVSNDHHNIL